MNSTKVCRICEGAHGYTTCPEPLRFPSTPQREGESEEAYAKRLRYNAYMAAWMARSDKGKATKAKRSDTLKAARRTPGSPLHENEKARGRRKYDDRRERLEKLKDRPCMDCGGRFPPCVMQFDHRDPSTKDRRFKSPGMMPGRTTWDAFLAEIEKCDLVCANCHAIRTHLTRRVGT